jgi:hypothetical protein
MQQITLMCVSRESFRVLGGISTLRSKQNAHEKNQDSLTRSPKKSWNCGLVFFHQKRADGTCLNRRSCHSMQRGNKLFVYSFIPLLPPRLHRLLEYRPLHTYIRQFCRGLDSCLPVFLFSCEDAKRNHPRKFEEWFQQLSGFPSRP